jgi:transposase-like protein
MTRHELAEAVAARYGLSDPTMEELLDEAYPDYSSNAYHMRAWHAASAEAWRLIDASMPNTEPEERTCKLCGGSMPAGCFRLRRYCSDRCMADATVKRVKAFTHKPLTGELREKVVRMYTAGQTYRAIAKAIGRGNGTVAATLHAAGVMRKSGRHNRRAA